MGDDLLDLDQILEGIRQTVAERRATGQYPEGMEEELDAHFRRIIESRPHVPRLALLRRKVEAARRAARFSPDRIPTGSQLPGGEVLHRGFARVFLRQAHGILLQVQEFADRILEALDAAVAVVERPSTHTHADLVELVDAHSELLADREKSPALAADRLEDALRRLERLEAAQASRRWRPWFSQKRFDEVFHPGRRDRAEAVARAKLEGVGPVLDLGVEVGADEHLLGALAADADRSWGAIVLLHADDRATAQDLVDLIGLALSKLQEGGRLVISAGAPNEDHESAKPRAFNPTLGPLLPVAYVAFACQEAGFSTVETEDWPPTGFLVVATV